MRSANKSPKFPDSTMVTSDLESASGTGSSSEVDQFFRLVGIITTPSFNEIGQLFLQ